MVCTVMMEWKWITYFQRTGKAYVKFKTDRYEKELKQDVFNSLKFYRFSVINLVNKIKAVNSNQLYKIYHYCFDKITNEASVEKN